MHLVGILFPHIFKTSFNIVSTHSYIEYLCSDSHPGIIIIIINIIIYVYILPVIHDKLPYTVHISVKLVTLWWNLCVFYCFAEGVQREIYCLPSATDRPMQFYIFIIVVNVNLYHRAKLEFCICIYYILFSFKYWLMVMFDWNM